MANTLPDLIFNNFCGIREQNGVNYGNQISAVTCKNVELFKSEIGNATGIRTVNGDKFFVSLPDGYKAVKSFSSVQDGKEYLFIYGENKALNISKLFYISYSNVIKTIEVPNEIEEEEEKEEETENTKPFNFSVTGKCNGITMAYGEYDVFIFTNGIEAISVCFSADVPIRQINAIDNQGRRLKWLSMTEWNGFLVVASQYGVHSSHKNDIYTWDDVVDGVEDSWYIDFGKRVTAVIAFSTGLFMFTDSDCSYINTTPNDTSNAIKQNVAMNGCFSFESLVVHDTYLFFYDDKQKGVFYIQITDTGQTRPVGSVTKEVQSYFTTELDTCKMYSCIYSTYNEIWLLINDKVLIYDYLNQEFVERDMRKINSICLYKNNVLTTSETGVYIEKISETFAGEYIPAEYQTSVINMGSSSNLKKQKMPLLLVLNSGAVNNFYVEITANYKAKNPKKINLKIANGGVFANENENAEINDNSKFDIALFCSENSEKKRVVKVSLPRIWYTLSIRIFTKEKGDGFNIIAMEMKRMKEKTKTIGQ